jgi:aminoglycoside phosphotransferase (APT) family kinase protein
MEQLLAQPGAAPLSEKLIAALLRSVGEPAEPAEVIFRDRHSNDFAEIRLVDGRTLIAKRGRYGWSASRFETSLAAAELLRMKAPVVAPRPLPLPRTLDQRPVEAYWRIDLPTLQEVWPELGPPEREQALRSWGELMARVHSIRLPGCGPLLEARRGSHSLDAFLRADLGSRLLPAITGEWQEAVELVEALLSAVEQIPERHLEQRGRFLHGDLHMGNVLCERTGSGVRCVGLIDLETALAGPPESDLASLGVHHGPLFEQPLEGEWYRQVLAGYGAALDPWLLALFRTYHLLNMGFYSALIGHHWHAGQVAAAARAEVACLGRTRRAPAAVAPAR